MNARADLSTRRGVGVIGGSGYIGAEVLRYLSMHPALEIRWVTANSHVGEPVDRVLPNLRGFVGGAFSSLEDARGRLGEVDAILVALPHNQSQDAIPGLAEAAPDVVIIDMGGDFRTNDPEGYRLAYGQEHAAPQWLERFVYGLTEYRREALRGAKLIANPGCFATTLDLALAPLAEAGKLRGDVFATGITGSSGAGNKLSPTTHHPERGNNVRAYKVLCHQHMLEVESFLGSLCDDSFDIHFVPQSGPYVRGIFATVFTPTIGVEELHDLFSRAYEGEALVHVVHGTPELRWVQGTPKAFVGVAGDESNGVVLCVTDNLGKGGAGQAVQNLNLALGLPETAGLSLAGGFV